MHFYIFKSLLSIKHTGQRPSKYKNEILDTKCPPPGSNWSWLFAKTCDKRHNGQPLREAVKWREKT